MSPENLAEIVLGVADVTEPDHVNFIVLSLWAGKDSLGKSSNVPFLVFKTYTYKRTWKIVWLLFMHLSPQGRLRRKAPPLPHVRESLLMV